MTRAAVKGIRTRRWVRPEDLDENGTLFGGSLLNRIDEEAAIQEMVFVNLDATGRPGPHWNHDIAANGIGSFSTCWKLSTRRRRLTLNA